MNVIQTVAKVNSTVSTENSKIVQRVFYSRNIYCEENKLKHLDYNMDFYLGIEIYKYVNSSYTIKINTEIRILMFSL